ncbi:PLP-dependent aminotransferase family protein [Actinomadura sp. DC4]|uniref:MocR-like pyridoxine biosynthesis transcription factor PdxR n=1 Tax=Actinomadura sp. DC4 TaxID=3055069 RepID=UPI0025B0F4BF|nr:PLP-dependent aminotransferase family protein [Actinomadura sp. DC4]MDN3354305.1 PLP-dependent aminotransferase family protein [Actinomadura sp. DC4]
MAIEWTGSGPELLMRLDRENGDPLHTQVEWALREAIQSGRLRAGERLPSTRRLSAELGLSRGLVVECYAQLQSEGYLSTRAGSATRVAAGATSLLPPPPPAAEPVRPRIDFRPGVPDLTGFPRQDWLWALGEACRTAPVADLTYGEAGGSGVLRAVLAAYARRVRGAVAHPEWMVVCAGFAQGLGLILDALAATGAGRVAFEEPGPAYRDVVTARARVEAVPVPVDEHGIDVAALAASGARAVVLTPAHQFPTGVVLSPERRHALLAWAHERDAVIVEDDYDAEFRYDREPIGALQGLAPDRVALIGTVSKSLAPALRLGWILCPPSLAATIAHGKRYDDRGSPVFDQLALARLIESGRFDRHLRRMRGVYAARRGTLIRALARHAPAVELGGLAAGLHAVARLPDHRQEEVAVAEARARSIGLYGMSAYHLDGRTRPPRLVLGFGHLRESEIEEGVAAVGDALG